MAVEILDEAMLRIAPADRAPEQLGSGYGGPHGPAEGPVWIHEGGYLLFSDIHGSRRMKWHPRDGVTLHKDGTANANGMTRDPQGRLVVCHHFSRCVDREEADGSITVIAERYRGLRFNRPNDVVVRIGRQHLLHRSAAAHSADAARPLSGARHRRRISRVRRPFARQHDHPRLCQSRMGCASRPTRRSFTSMTPTRGAS